MIAGLILHLEHMDFGVLRQMRGNGRASYAAADDEYVAIMICHRNSH
jgi:hypothetical protein